MKGFHYHGTFTPTWPLTLCSIDPGTNNFALRVERRSRLVSSVGTSVKVATLLQVKWALDARDVYRSLTAYLDSVYALLAECDAVLIEQQTMVNIKTVRLVQHIVSYTQLRSLKACVVECCKTSVNVAVGLPGRASKAEVVELGQHLLHTRQDLDTIKSIGTRKTGTRKADDAYDTILQAEAFCRTHTE